MLVACARTARHSKATAPSAGRVLARHRRLGLVRLSLSLSLCPRRNWPGASDISPIDAAARPSCTSRPFSFYAELEFQVDGAGPLANGKPTVVLVRNTALLGLWGAPRGFRFDGTRQTFAASRKSLAAATRKNLLAAPSSVALCSVVRTYALLFPRATDAVALLSLPIRGGLAGGRRQQTRLTRQPRRDEGTQRHEGTDLDGPSSESYCRSGRSDMDTSQRCKRPTVPILIHRF